MNATESRGLEKCALSTLFHFSEIMGQEVPTIDPGLFSDSGFRRLAEVIGEIGAFQLPVMNAVKGEEYASAALFEIMECYTSHSIPLDFLDRMVLSHLRKLTRGRAIELAARELESGLGLREGCADKSIRRAATTCKGPGGSSSSPLLGKQSAPPRSHHGTRSDASRMAADPKRGRASATTYVFDKSLPPGAGMLREATVGPRTPKDGHGDNQVASSTSERRG